MSLVVVCTSALPPRLSAEISEILGGVTYVAPENGDFSRADLLDAVADADGLISLLSFAVDEELLARARKLRVIANFAVGFDNVDVPAATARAIPVTNTPDVLTEATADFTFALMLATARHIVAGDAWMRTGDWPGWGPGQLLGADVHGATLGIVGLGRIGEAVARRARGFDMNILYSTRTVRHDAERLRRDLGAERVDATRIDDMLCRADFVSLHCPLTAQTRQIIDDAALSTMKSSALLINTARGGCVDEAALVRALERGSIAGAGLDVFAAEPSVHPGLVASDKVVLAPHAGSATYTARRRMAQICATAVRSVFDERRPPTVINPEVYA